MTQAEQINGLSRAIEGMSKDLRTLTGTLNANVARCEACRKIVLGNGGTKPIDRRVTRLEEARSMSRGMVVGLCMVMSAICSMVGAVVAVVCS